jgi:hypothetical protein
VGLEPQRGSPPRGESRYRLPDQLPLVHEIGCGAVDLKFWRERYLVMILTGYENGYMVDVSLVTCRPVTAAYALVPLVKPLERLAYRYGRIARKNSSEGAPTGS